MEAVYHRFPAPTIIIGSDSLSLNKQVLASAIEGLKSWEAVIGPASDGGYYLIGLQRPRPQLFLNRTWSHAQVLKEQLALFATFNISVKILAEGNDLDTLEDLKALSLGDPSLFAELTQGMKIIESDFCL